MKTDLYEIVEVKDDFLVFEFTSEGPKGRVIKMVSYSTTNIPNLYNLGFGDKDTYTGKIDDKVITNNGDSKKVMATVASTVDMVLKHYPKSWIYAKGSNDVRTRLYRIAISNNLHIIQPGFEILGSLNDEWHQFQKNVDYKAFLLRRKNVILNYEKQKDKKDQ